MKALDLLYSLLIVLFCELIDNKKSESANNQCPTKSKATVPTKTKGTVIFFVYYLLEPDSQQDEIAVWNSESLSGF